MAPTTTRTLADSTSLKKPKKGSRENADGRRDSICSNVSSASSTSSSSSQGTPYIPSYMDLTNGPEPCVVCTDAATGYHYRCMTCEGCKGFFRRTIQKNLQYHCKWNNNCVIDKTTRNQCQQCRYRKCVAVGMATDLVLNERQRKAKRKLIEDNRERRRSDTVKMKLKHESCPHDHLTLDDRELIEKVKLAYEETSPKLVSYSLVSNEVFKMAALSAILPALDTGQLGTFNYYQPECESLKDQEGPFPVDRADPVVWQQLAEVMTPSIVRVVEFAKQVPGFTGLNVDDQILLLKSCCMEIMCLRAACRYDPEQQGLTLHNGMMVSKQDLANSGNGSLGLLIEPIFDFAVGLAKLKLDKTEIALLAAVLLIQSDRSGLKEPEAVEKLQDAVLGAFKRYIAEERPSQPVHWAKILMKVTDLRTISTRHAERVLCIKLDCPGEIPPMFLEMFNEGNS
ncbi:thyroid hormone receptor beta-like [Lineus longissimus]|uniref:thyroid hormone receptor beta-like n=1 Tax=Lineus longissimus TaxID=88925 RepID=UPI00315DECA4